MALWQVDIEKIVGTESWTNVYHCDVADTAAAIVVAGQLKDLERPIHGAAVTFVGARVRLAGPGHVGTVVLYNQLGTRTITGNLMPLFCGIRVDFGNLTKRPARKYLRGGFGGSEIQANFLCPAAFVTLTTTYADGVLAIASIRDSANRQLVSRAVLTPVQMHQLRRGNRRSPVI